MKFNAIALLHVTQSILQYLVPYLLKEVSSIGCRIFAIDAVAFAAALLN